MADELTTLAAAASVAAAARRPLPQLRGLG
jgi:hypothetical protein